jgi:hypothetical protein
MFQDIEIQLDFAVLGCNSNSNRATQPLDFCIGHKILNLEQYPIAHHYHNDVCTYAKVKSLEDFTTFGLRMELPLV